MKVDRIIKEAVMRAKHKFKTPCPDEETFAAFIEKKLPAEQYQEVAAHFLACDQCREAAIAAWGKVPQRVRVPVEAMKKAADAIPAHESTWKLVVRFASDFIEVIKNTGAETRYFSPAYASGRSPSETNGVISTALSAAIT